MPYEDLERTRHAVETYLDAKWELLRMGYAHEIDWQARLEPASIEESTFLAEAAWVILSAGFRASTVDHLFPSISEAFLDWSNAERIDESAADCIEAALLVFNHRPKISAIAKVAGIVSGFGDFRAFWAQVQTDPVRSLSRMPYVGPVTSLHLAKNLGFDVAKPDRHLQRVSRFLQFETPDQLCRTVSTVVGDRVAVVDVVFWRFATIFPDFHER